MSITHLHSSAEFRSALSSSSKLKVIDFHATWCGPCKMIAPQFEEFSKKYKGTDFYKVDVDEVPDVAQTCGVQAMPTFKFFKGGQNVGEVVGGDMGQVEALIQKHGSSSSFSGEGRTLGGSSGDRPTKNPWVEKYEKQKMEPTVIEEKKEEKMEVEEEMDDELQQALLLSMQQTTGSETTEVENKETKTEEKKEGDAPSHEDLMKMLELSVNEEMLKELLSIDVSKLRALKALYSTHSKSTEAALKWLSAHANDADIDDPIEFKDETPEEQAERAKKQAENAKAYLEEKKKEKIAREKKEAKEEEKRRREFGKKSVTSQEEIKKAQAKRERDLEKRQKKEDKARMKQLQEQIKKDKERRAMERAKTRGEIVQSSSNPSTTTTTTTKIETKKEYTEAVIQIRLLDGSTITAKFQPTDKISTIASHVEFLTKNSSFYLMTNFPKKIYKEGDQSTTLKDAGLVPKAQLICVAK
eukprot:gene8719-665_t